MYYRPGRFRPPSTSPTITLTATFKVKSVFLSSRTSTRDGSDMPNVNVSLSALVAAVPVCHHAASRRVFRRSLSVSMGLPGGSYLSRSFIVAVFTRTLLKSSPTPADMAFYPR